MADIVAPDVCDGMSAVGERRLCTPILTQGSTNPRTSIVEPIELATGAA